MWPARQTAAERDFNAYLWLIDDVAIESDGLCRLVDISEIRLRTGQESCIIEGATRHPDRATGRPSYGGLAAEGVMPLADQARRIDYFNGNVVFVQWEMYDLAGSFLAVFMPGMADLDCGIRARRKGVAVWLVAGVVGWCRTNGLPLRQRRDVSLWTWLVVLRWPTGCPRWPMVLLIWQNAGWWFPWLVLKLDRTAIFPPLPQVLA